MFASFLVILLGIGAKNICLERHSPLLQSGMVERRDVAEIGRPVRVKVRRGPAIRSAVANVLPAGRTVYTWDDAGDGRG